MTPYSLEERQLLNEKYGGVVSEDFERDRERLSSGEPLAYVIGMVPFLGARIHLASRPLIPRVESEYWLSRALDETRVLRANESLAVLDMCAGSGALGVAWGLHRPRDTVTFCDIRPDHIETVKKNCEENGLAPSRVSFCVSDLWEHVSGAFDVILANPPYIPVGRVLDESVTRFEPADALFSEEDGLFHARRIIEGAFAHLAPRGTLYLEHDTGQERVLEAYFDGRFSTRRVNDQYGRSRVIVAYYMYDRPR